MIKKIINITIPLFLLSLWLSVPSLYIKKQEFGFSTLDGRYQDDILGGEKTGKFLKGEVVSGTFQSFHPNLGIVSVRFRTFFRINNDQIEFRIKELGDDDWFYKAIHNTDQFQPNQLFPFGFPSMADSENKEYYFELESLGGTEENATGINTDKPSVVTRHIFNRENPKELIYLLTHKFTNLLTDINFTNISIICALPLFFYLLNLFAPKNYGFVFTCIFILIGWDIFFLDNNFDLLFITVSLAWLWGSIKYKLKSQVTLTIVLLHLILSIALTSFTPAINQESMTNKTITWVYLLSFAVVIQSIYQLKTKKIFTQTSKDFFHELISIPSVISFKINQTNHKLKTLLKTFSIRFKAFTKDYTIYTNLFNEFFAINIRLDNKTFTVLKIRLLLLKKITRITLIANSYLIVLWVVWKLVITDLIGFVKFYLSFFPENQLVEYFINTGIYQCILTLIVMLSIYLLVRITKLKPVTKFLIIIAILIFTGKINQIIFDKNTSSFRSSVYVWRIYPRKGTLWDEITIKGRNFKNLPFKGKVYVAGQEHRIIFWSDQKIIFQGEPGKTKSGQVKVVDINGKESNPVELEFYDYFTGEIL